jgi:glycine oxidase
VLVIDPGAENASSVAAGMIAPAMEAAAENAGVQHAALLQHARDLWPAFAETFGVSLLAGGAEWRGAGMDEMERRMHALGFEARRDRQVLIAAEELQIDPLRAMPMMRSQVRSVSGRASALRREHGKWVISCTTGDAVGETVAKVVILATGAGPALAGLPALTTRLVNLVEPIRGQIGRIERSLVEHAVRGQGVYVAPGTTRSVIGATMDAGRRDLEPDPAQSEQLVVAASELLARDLSNETVAWRVGVRGASPDGLPMVGRAPDAEDVWLSLAPRRNGWLLGPLAGRIVSDEMFGIAPDSYGRMLDPCRFEQTAGGAC